MSKKRLTAQYFQHPEGAIFVQLNGLAGCHEGAVFEQVGLASLIHSNHCQSDQIMHILTTAKSFEIPFIVGLQADPS